MTKKWVPLHLHTVFSNFDGTIQVPALVKWAEEHEAPAVAVTDHGIMSAVPSLLKATAKSAVKPIFGCELYMDPVLPNPQGQRPAHHLIALAATERGYRNLLKLLSIAHKDNYYMKPRATIETVEAWSEGIIFSSACIAGELPSLLLRGDWDGARRFLNIMQTACKGNFFIELMDTGERDLRQMAMNESLYALAKETGTRTIFTCDAHYFSGEESWYPHILAVNKRKTFAEMKNASEKTASEYDDNDISMYDLSLRSPDYMWDKWGSKYGEALAGTVHVANMIERYKIVPDSYYMPSSDVLGGTPLPELARRGLENRLSGLSGGAEISVYRERLESELNMVGQMGFNDYFLMVHDMVDWARSSGIFVGPGRGSAAGSLLAWSLGITAVDPIRHNLFFERFLNPERVSMPDIDVDFEDARRGEVIQYLGKRYGESSVSGIIGYTEAKWKSALRDASRTLGYGAGDGDLGGMFVNAGKDFIDAENYDSPAGRTTEAPLRLAEAAMLKDRRLQDKKEDLLKIASLAQKFLSLVRHYTRHASGVVIAPPDVTDHCPLYNLKGIGECVAQYDMAGIEDMKLVKMDILGLSNLTLMKKIYNESLSLDPSTPSPDMLYSFLDASGEDMTEQCAPGSVFHEHISKESILNTISVLGEGATTGVFQLFSPGMRRLLRSIRPSNIDALSALVALYRPGPLTSGMTKAYEDISKGSQGTGLVATPFPKTIGPLVKDVTRDSRGLVIYQEQVMKIAQVLGGYSLGEADMLRRAMGKKDASVMSAERSRFIAKCMEKGLPEGESAETFDTLAHFAGYGFNKSHSTAYAYVAFATAWYKTNREPVFWSSFLDLKNAHEKKENMAPYLRECARKWRLMAPAFLATDRSPADSAASRVVRDGGEVGAEFPTLEGIKKANALLWMEPAYWTIFLGASHLGRMSGAKIDGLEDIGTCDDFLSLTKFLIMDPKGSGINPKNVAQLTLAGVFDRLLGNKSLLLEEDRRMRATEPDTPATEADGLKQAPDGDGSESGQMTLFGEPNTRKGPKKKKAPLKKTPTVQELFEDCLEEDFVTPGRVAVPVLRSQLIMLEKEMESDSRLQAFVEDSLSRLVKPGTDITERLRNTDRDRFLAWYSLLVTRLRAKAGLSRSPWGEEDIETALKPFRTALRYMSARAAALEQKFFTDSSVRLSLSRALYRRDAVEFSEGLAMPSWVLASELVGWTMAGYADELDAFMKASRDEQFRNATPWGKEIEDEGLWFIGYVENSIIRRGERLLIISGRWGNGEKVAFVTVPQNIKLNGVPKGECAALRLRVNENENGWRNWEATDFRVLPLMSPGGEERVELLPGGESGPVIRAPSDLPEESKRLMWGYLRGMYRGAEPGRKTVWVASAPFEITDAAKVTFKEASLPTLKQIKNTRIADVQVAPTPVAVVTAGCEGAGESNEAAQDIQAPGFSL